MVAAAGRVAAAAAAAGRVAAAAAAAGRVAVAAAAGRVLRFFLHLELQWHPECFFHQRIDLFLYGEFSGGGFRASSSWSWTIGGSFF